jgi:hypothetical protein
MPGEDIPEPILIAEHDRESFRITQVIPIIVLLDILGDQFPGDGCHVVCCGGFPEQAHQLGTCGGVGPVRAHVATSCTC